MVRSTLLTSLFLISAASAETIISIQSDAGDYIGQGQDYYYTDDNANFSYSTNFDNGITVRINDRDNSYSFWWTLDLAAPNNEQLTVGTYEGATRFPFQEATNPGLNFSGSGRGCNTSTGRFIINEIEYNDDEELTKLVASFEQHCEGFVPALRGTISYVAPKSDVLESVVLVRDIKPIRAVCRNVTTGQRVVTRSGSSIVDCEEMGLIVNPYDKIRINIVGYPSDSDR